MNRQAACSTDNIMYEDRGGSNFHNDADVTPIRVQMQLMIVRPAEFYPGIVAHRGFEPVDILDAAVFHIADHGISVR